MNEKTRFLIIMNMKQTRVRACVREEFKRGNVEISWHDDVSTTCRRIIFHCRVIYLSGIQPLNPSQFVTLTSSDDFLQDISAAGMEEADDHYYSVADGHVGVSSKPQKSNKVRRCFREAQTPLFLLVNLALLGLTIEAYFISRLYRLMPVSICLFCFFFHCKAWTRWTIII